ncbi:DUF1761 domain-containing protein [Emticicia agri]|uniref:DUF1761 domain-containing protein n=1 Tax=Emticicia agri TaxID=2492393 RepID=A0A4Q5LTA1_9BACT|nr:DUF1761 domain-containing protein [Emticicia agri]RYU92784.1 DUF1761 domain-containing protein [Emticicia agri]
MINQLANLNWISVIIAFVVYNVIGALWFTLFFSKPYKMALGKENETLPNNPIFIAGPAICTFVVTLTFAILLYALNIRSLGDAIGLSLLIGTGFLVANTTNIAINPNIPRPILYSIISGTYHLVGIMLVGVILVMMR